MPKLWQETTSEGVGWCDFGKGAIHSQSEMTEETKQLNKALADAEDAHVKDEAFMFRACVLDSLKLIVAEMLRLRQEHEKLVRLL